MIAVDGLKGFHIAEMRQGGFIRRMMILSFLLHGGAAMLSMVISPLFPSRVFPPVVIFELTDLPQSELPEEKPRSFPAVVARSPDGPVAPSDARPPRQKEAQPHRAHRWLDKLDSSLAGGSDAPVTGKTVKTGGLPVRRWENGASPRPGDFAPLVAPEKNLGFGKQLDGLEKRIRQSGRPGIGIGKGGEIGVMFSGTGSSAGDPIPEWIRDMIRRKVRGYLPELEAAYSAAIRRNPGLKGKLLVRFRIDSSGKIQRADSVESSFSDDAFVAGLLDRVRRWTFDPTAGLTVEVLYPFVFVAPS